MSKYFFNKWEKEKNVKLKKNLLLVLVCPYHRTQDTQPMPPTPTPISLLRPESQSEPT